MKGCRSICITGRCESPCDDMERYREEQEDCEAEHEPEPDERPGDGGGRACSSGLSADEALAERLVRSPRWRWLPGMLARTAAGRPRRITGVVSEPLRGQPRERVVAVVGRRSVDLPPSARKGWLPDLSDAATLGGILALVREAWPHPVEVPFARYNSRQARWECWVWPVDLPHRPPRCYTGATEPECLIAALEGAGDDMTVHETLQ